MKNANENNSALRSHALMARRFTFIAAVLMVLSLLWTGSFLWKDSVGLGLFGMVAVVSTLAAVFHGLADGKCPPLRKRWMNRGIVKLIFGLVILSLCMGMLDSCGESESIKAQGVYLHAEDIMEQYGELRNQHRINMEICRRVYVTCGTVMILWAWLVFIYGVTERLTARRMRKQKCLASS